MRRQLLDIENSKPMASRHAFDRHERKVRKVLMVDGIELVFLDQPLKMGKLECNHAIRRQQDLHTRNKIVEVRDLRQHIVADDEVSAAALHHQPLREGRTKELDKSRDAFRASYFSHIFASTWGPGRRYAETLPSPCGTSKTDRSPAPCAA